MPSGTEQQGIPCKHMVSIARAHCLPELIDNDNTGGRGGSWRDWKRINNIIMAALH